MQREEIHGSEDSSGMIHEGKMEIDGEIWNAGMKMWIRRKRLHRKNE